MVQSIVASRVGRKLRAFYPFFRGEVRVAVAQAAHLRIIHSLTGLEFGQQNPGEKRFGINVDPGILPL